MKTLNSDLLLPALRKFASIIASPELSNIFGLTIKDWQLIAMLQRRDKTLKGIADDLQISEQKIIHRLYRFLDRIHHHLLLNQYAVTNSHLVKKEIEELRAENEAYRQRFELLAEKEKELAGDISVLKRPIESLQINTRLWNALKYSKINTIGDLMQWSEESLLRQNSMGQKSLALLKERLAEINLVLRKKGLHVAQTSGLP